MLMTEVHGIFRDSSSLFAGDIQKTRKVQDSPSTLGQGVQHKASDVSRSQPGCRSLGSRAHRVPSISTRAPYSRSLQKKTQRIILRIHSPFTLNPKDSHSVTLSKHCAQALKGSGLVQGFGQGRDP